MQLKLYFRPWGEEKPAPGPQEITDVLLTASINLIRGNYISKERVLDKSKR